MGLFTPRNQTTESAANAGRAQRLNQAQRAEQARRGRNTVTVSELQCRSSRRTGRAIFGGRSSRG